MSGTRGLRTVDVTIDSILFRGLARYADTYDAFRKSRRFMNMLTYDALPAKTIPECGSDLEDWRPDQIGPTFHRCAERQFEEQNM
jgi:hypothetical protein